IIASEKSWGEPGAFMTAFTTNQSNASIMSLDGSPVARPLIELVSGKVQIWEGSASQLLATLRISGNEFRSPAGRPVNARALSVALRRLSPALRAAGIRVSFIRSGSNTTIRIERAPGLAKLAPAPAANNITSTYPEFGAAGRSQG